MNSLEYARRKRGLNRKIAADILGITPRKLKIYEETRVNPVIFVEKVCELYRIKFEDLKNLENRLDDIKRCCKV